MKLLFAAFCIELCIINLIKGQYNDFKNIPGPKSLGDKIAIIGAGPAGIHMAYRLQQEGFTNVVILEKSNRIGGMSYSVPHRGVSHEMGTCFAQVDYGKIFNLTADFGAGDIKVYPDRKYWLSKYIPLDFEVYMALHIGITSLEALENAVKDEVDRYSTKHYELFGNYEGELMPRPSKAVLREVRGTFKDFLFRNNFRILYEAFQYSHTMQGYGRLDDVAALYGLMWMTPKFAQALANTDIPNIYTLEDGFQTLWEKIVQQSNIDIKFGVDIKRIVRGYRSGITIDYQYRLSGDSKREKYDFLILTPDLPSLKNIVDFGYKERSLFNKISDKNYFITSLIDSTPGRRSASPINFFVYNLKRGQDYRVWVSVDKYAAVHNITGDDYKQGLTQGGDNCASCQTAVLYQYGSRDPNSRYGRYQIKRYLADHLTTYEQKDAVMIKQNIWPYFFRFPPREMEKGIIWDVFDIQGTRNTWYAGASVSFESVKSVVDYNDLLLRQTTLPS